MAKYNGAVAKVVGIEKLIQTMLGVEAEHHEQYDRLQIRPDDRVQSRIDKNNAPKAMVDRYAYQMGESEFPPIIVTSDGWKIDGNTREKAYAKRNQRYISALVVPIAYETADESVRRKLLFLSETINNMNGLPLDNEERKKMVITMIEEGAPDDDIVTKVGVSHGDIRELRDWHRAAARLKHVGFAEEAVEKLSDSTLRAFGKHAAMALDDNAFGDLATLTVESGMKANEVKALATSLKEAGTEELRRERLARERQAREPQITAIASGNVQLALARSLRTRLTFLLQNPVTSFVEHNPELVAEHLETIDKAIEVLQEVKTLNMTIPAANQSAEGVRPS